MEDLFEGRMALRKRPLIYITMVDFSSYPDPKAQH